MAGKDDIMPTEKVNSRKVAIGESSESTRRHGFQSAEETHKLSISIQKKVTPDDRSSLDDKIRRLRKSYEKSKDKPRQAKIQKVHFALRGHKYFKQYFEPRAVALGPIHHGKPGYELAEEYKPRLAEYFIQESGCDEYKMYNAVETDIENLKACYEEEVTKCYSDKELAWILFLDGSSLLGFITCAMEGRFEEMNVKNDLAAFGQQDTFLLENQLPYQLLKLLIDQSISTQNKDRWNKNIHDFLNKTRKDTMTLKKSRSADGSARGDRTESISDDCPHLLHLLRGRLLGDKETQKPKDIAVNVTECCKLVGCLFKPHHRGDGDSDDDPTTFRNIKELKSAGIRVRCNNSSCLNQISFKSSMFFSTLYLPSIVVDDWTAPKFLNLAAYEMCPDFHNDFGITSHICFLDSLIDQPEDVKDLRDADILYNILGSDEEVATLFNKISTDLVTDNRAYFDVKKRIQRHYKRAWTEWVALGYHKHCSNPWTLLALIGALLGLALSFIQALTALDKSCTKICPA